MDGDKREGKIKEGEEGWEENGVGRGMKSDKGERNRGRETRQRAKGKRRKREIARGSGRWREEGRRRRRGT